MNHFGVCTTDLFPRSYFSCIKFVLTSCIRFGRVKLIQIDACDFVSTLLYNKRYFKMLATNYCNKRVDLFDRFYYKQTTLN